METFEGPINRMVALPKRVFKPAEKVVVFLEKDLVVFKRLDPPRLSSIAARAPGRTPSMRTILREVQAFRRAKRP